MLIRILMIALFAITLEGCAAGRSTVVLEEINTTPQPENGVEVAIVKVVDAREFESTPKNPNVPSLDPSDGEAGVLKDQLIGRKRNAYGKALGSVLLPENETISSWVQKIATEGFRLAGYRVLEENDPKYSEANKVDIQVNKFWAWFNPGFWTVTASNEAEISLKSDLIAMKDSIAIANKFDSAPQGAITDNDWSLVTNENSKILAQKIAEHLKK